MNELYFDKDTPESALRTGYTREKSIRKDISPDLERQIIDATDGLSHLSFRWDGENPYVGRWKDKKNNLRRLKNVLGGMLRDSVPMNYPQWIDVPESIQHRFIDKIKTIYDVDMTSKGIFNFIEKRARIAFKERKNKMKPFYVIYRDTLRRNGIPIKLKGRKEERKWLVEYFDDEDVQNKSLIMAGHRTLKPDHNMGSITFAESLAALVERTTRPVPQRHLGSRTTSTGTATSPTKQN